MRGLDPRIHLLCKRVFTEEGCIAPQLGLALVAVYNPPQVGQTRLAVSSPAMTILKIVSMCAAKSHNNTKEESNGQQAR
jgi:hypothetical protein